MLTIVLIRFSNGEKSLFCLACRSGFSAKVSSDSASSLSSSLATATPAEMTTPQQNGLSHSEEMNAELSGKRFVIPPDDEPNTHTRSSSNKRRAALATSVVFIVARVRWSQVTDYDHREGFSTLIADYYPESCEDPTLDHLYEWSTAKEVSDWVRNYVPQEHESEMPSKSQRTQKPVSSTGTCSGAASVSECEVTSVRGGGAHKGTSAAAAAAASTQKSKSAAASSQKVKSTAASTSRSVTRSMKVASEQRSRLGAMGASKASMTREESDEEDSSTEDGSGSATTSGGGGGGSSSQSSKGSTVGAGSNGGSARVTDPELLGFVFSHIIGKSILPGAAGARYQCVYITEAGKQVICHSEDQVSELAVKDFESKIESGVFHFEPEEALLRAEMCGANDKELQKFLKKMSHNAGICVGMTNCGIAVDVYELHGSEGCSQVDLWCDRCILLSLTSYNVFL